MKKISWILVLCLAALLLTGCTSDTTGSTAAKETPGIEMPSLENVLTEHKAFEVDSGDGYTDYQIIYYGNDTHPLRKIAIETFIDKSAGYTEAYLNDLDLEKIYPGFNSYSFASKQLVDDGDHFTLIVIFDELENMDYIQQLEDNGVIEVVHVDGAEYMDADSYMDLLRSEGCKELSITDDAYTQLHY